MGIANEAKLGASQSHSIRKGYGSALRFHHLNRGTQGTQEVSLEERRRKKP